MVSPVNDCPSNADRTGEPIAEHEKTKKSSTETVLFFGTPIVNNPNEITIIGDVFGFVISLK